MASLARLLLLLLLVEAVGIVSFCTIVGTAICERENDDSTYREFSMVGECVDGWRRATTRSAGRRQLIAAEPTQQSPGDGPAAAAAQREN